MTQYAAFLAATALGTLAAATPPALAQQPGKVFQIGILSPAGSPSTKAFDAFRNGLRQFGYIEGSNGRKAFGDYATMTAAALAFYSLLGIVPVLIALATFYGLVANPAAVQSLIEELRGFVPTQAANVLADSLKSSGQGFGLGIGFAVSLGIVLWTAQ